MLHIYRRWKSLDDLATVYHNLPSAVAVNLFTICPSSLALNTRQAENVYTMALRAIE